MSQRLYSATAQLKDVDIPFISYSTKDAETKIILTSSSGVTSELEADEGGGDSLELSGI